MRFTGMGRALALALATPLAACGNYLADVSSGQIGCEPERITIQNVETGIYRRTWKAICGGRVYLCTLTFGQPSCRRRGGGDGDEAQEEPAAPVRYEGPSEERREREPPARTSDPPTGAGGFTLGSSVAAASQLCTGSGHDWTASEKDLYRCNGTPTDLGFAASSRLRFCGGELCSVTLIVTLDDQDKARWVERYSSIRAALVKKYGAISGRTEDVPDACAHTVPECLARGAMAFESRWTWDGGASIRLVLGRFEGISGVGIVYRNQQDALKPKLDGL
jgi:hypothetical protein